MFWVFVRHWKPQYDQGLVYCKSERGISCVSILSNPDYLDVADSVNSFLVASWMKSMNSTLFLWNLPVNFLCSLFYGVHTPPCAIACIYICAYVKDPVVNVKSSVEYGNTKTPSVQRRLGRVTVTAGSPRAGNPNFPWQKSHWDNTVVKKKKSQFLLS